MKTKAKKGKQKTKEIIYTMHIYIYLKNAMNGIKYFNNTKMQSLFYLQMKLHFLNQIRYS